MELLTPHFTGSVDLKNVVCELDFSGKKFKIEIDSSIWREEIG
jgi:hypothetical protein